MRKRAGLARALALDPEILFLDEPTAGLDPIAAADFDRLIGDLKASLGLTVFLVTHDLDTLFAICDRVAVLVDNKIRIGTLAQHLAGPPSLDPRLFSRSRARAAAAAAASPDPAQALVRSSLVRKWKHVRITPRSAPLCWRWSCSPSAPCSGWRAAI